MPNTVKANIDADVVKAMLMTFALHGFKKTSMECIGRAAGVSRQSIYKKFGSKEACYEWVIHAYVSNIYTRIFAVMEDNTSEPQQTLIDAMDILIGEAIEIVNNPHGAIVYEYTLKLTQTSPEDWPLRFRARMASFLERNNLASEETAEGASFAIIYAGKGLLLESPSREQFLKNMRIIITSVISQQK